MNFTSVLPAALRNETISFRNIYTIFPSQDLMDDIISPGNRNDLISALDRAQTIDSEMDQKFRIFQYGKTLDTWPEFNHPGTNLLSLGRFSGKDFAVWYGALEEETSIRETLFHGYHDTIKEVERFSERPIITQYRRMFEVKLEGEKVIDLRKIKNLQKQLVQEDTTFCQQLGSYAFQNEIDFYFTPSARKKGGTCTPVFPTKGNVPNQNTIKVEKFKYYLQFQYFKDQKIPKVKKIDQIEMDLDIDENFL